MSAEAHAESQSGLNFSSYSPHSTNSPSTNSPSRTSAPPLTKLLIVRLGAMGDVIHALPAVQLLREAFPQAYFGWLIEERWAELLCAPGAARRGPRSALRPVVDEVHAANLKVWRKSPFSLATLQRVATLWNDVREAGYDAVLDLQGAVRSAVLARLSRARVVYGAAEAWESPASLWYSRKVVARGEHVIEQNLSLARAVVEHYCGLSSQASAVKLPCDPAIEARTAEDLARHEVGEFAILNPGAGWGAKRWPAERYGELAKALAAMGISPLVNYGPGEEDLFRKVLAASGRRAQPAMGSISELIALTRRARILVGGDTGPLHLAAALGVPVVGIYGPTDPARNGPYGTRSVVLRSRESRTSHARVTETEEGMMGIRVDEVMRAVRNCMPPSIRNDFS